MYLPRLQLCRFLKSHILTEGGVSIFSMQQHHLNLNLKSVLYKGLNSGACLQIVQTYSDDPD